MFGLFKSKQRQATPPFDEIFNEHQQFVTRLAYNLTGDHSEAQDITQEVFVAVMQSLDSFRGDARLSTWIYRITVRTAGRHLSRKKPYVALDEAQQCHGPTPADTPLTEKQLLAALQKLTLPQRTLLTLVTIDGLSHAEVAEILGVPVGTIGSRLFNARKQLAAIIESPSTAS